MGGAKAPGGRQLLALRLGGRADCGDLARLVDGLPCTVRYVAGSKAFLAVARGEAWRVVAALQLAGVAVEGASLADPEALTVAEVVVRGVWRPRPAAVTDPLVGARRLVLEPAGEGWRPAVREAVSRLAALSRATRLVIRGASPRAELRLSDPRGAARELRRMQAEGLGGPCRPVLRVVAYAADGRPVLGACEPVLL